MTLAAQYPELIEKVYTQFIPCTHLKIVLLIKEAYSFSRLSLSMRKDSLTEREPQCFPPLFLSKHVCLSSSVGIPNAIFPSIYCRFGVNILKSKPLRQFANYLSYSDKSFASEEAMYIGRLHCLLDDWERAACDFSRSGGFILSDKIVNVKQKTLILWGREDKILEPSTAEKFVELLPSSELIWVENCGHVPHLEQPEVTPRAILDFLREAI